MTSIFFRTMSILGIKTTIELSKSQQIMIGSKIDLKNVRHL